VRLGRDDEVVVAFKAADEAVLGIWRAAGRLRLEPEPDRSSSAAAQVRTLNDENRAEIDSHRTEFDAARERFVAAAHTAAGARLD
jgi:outer membrane murein-binding lipoprotein Lpp